MNSMFLRALGFVIATILFLVFSISGNHRSWNITSDTAKSYAAKLTGQPSKGVPLIVFTSDHCPGCGCLEGDLKDRHVQYIRADVDTDRNAQILQRQVGRCTPTTVVGTKVIITCDAKDILFELAEQRLNRDFY